MFITCELFITNYKNQRDVAYRHVRSSWIQSDSVQSVFSQSGSRIQSVQSITIIVNLNVSEYLSGWYWIRFFSSPEFSLDLVKNSHFAFRLYWIQNKGPESRLIQTELYEFSIDWIQTGFRLNIQIYISYSGLSLTEYSELSLETESDKSRVNWLDWIFTSRLVTDHFS